MPAPDLAEDIEVQRGGGETQEQEEGDVKTEASRHGSVECGGARRPEQSRVALTDRSITTEKREGRMTPGGLQMCDMPFYSRTRVRDMLKVGRWSLFQPLVRYLIRQNSGHNLNDFQSG